MPTPLPTYTEWRASVETNLREAREAGEGVCHPLEGQPDEDWRRYYDGFVTLMRTYDDLFDHTP
ncbi:hypothetical protein [Deinococcus enclensis]|uniref:Uncharacterized protein n=1 Tax=Deinococcus enclensis TaxID=1049582 RepID=A0ABT9MDC0_9DEIO|nr:hypothetical protein [Deinococcus enclensis]MDP9764611.1 hypothetical protein [Deinococcus enclensis]